MITELRNKRAELVKDARELLDTAEAEERDLNADEQKKYDDIMADVDQMGVRISRLEKLDGIESRLKEPASKPLIPLELSGDENGQAENPRARKEYRESYNQYLRRGLSGILPEEMRALQVGTDSEGGYLVPDEFDRQLIQALQDANIMRAMATVIQTSGTHNIPMVSSHGTASWIAEEGSFSLSDEAFTQVVIGANKLGTMIKVSEELLQDNAYNLESYLVSEFGRRIGAAEEAAFVNGDGSGKPTGVIGSGTVGVTAAAVNAVTADEIMELYHALSRPYRARAQWLMADATALAIRKLKDGNGQYMWQPGLQAGQPDMLMGRSVAISDSVQTMAATKKVIAIGDFSYYTIGDRGGRSFQRLVELYAVNGQVGFRAWERTDGKLTLPETVQVLQMHA